MNPFSIDADTLSTGALRHVVFSLGSNLGERWAHLEEGVALLRATPDMEVTGISPVYETPAVGGPEDNPDFLNAIVVARTTQSAEGLLARITAIEEAANRTRAVHWGPRTLDVDIIVHGDKIVDLPRLTIPHKRAHERAFVLQPWFDLEPDATIPGRGSVRELLEATDASQLRRLKEPLDA